jgi:large subunit ribosomal protein L15
LPKRGFTNLFRKSYAPLNIGTLDAAIEAGKVDGSQMITEVMLIAAGLGNDHLDGVRLLGVGEIKRAINITVSGASATAKAAVEAAGGTVTTTVLREAKAEA